MWQKVQNFGDFLIINNPLRHLYALLQSFAVFSQTRLTYPQQWQTAAAAGTLEAEKADLASVEFAQYVSK